MAGLADIPFYGAYRQVSDANQQAGMQEQTQVLQQAGSLASLQAALQAQAQKNAVDKILASSANPQDALANLTKAGLTGIQAAHALAQTLEAQQNITDRSAWSTALSGIARPPTGIAGASTAAPSVAPQPQVGVTNPPADAPWLDASRLTQPEQQGVQPAQNGRKTFAEQMRTEAEKYQGILSSNPSLSLTAQGKQAQQHITNLLEAANKIDPIETFSAPTSGIGPDGKPIMNRYGNRGGVMPVTDLAPLPHPMSISQGNKVSIVDALRPDASQTSFPVSVTPSAALAASTARRGQDMADTRARELSAIPERLYQQYSSNPVVKTANELDTRLTPVINYMTDFTKSGKSSGANDLELVRLYLATTTPAGVRVLNMQTKEIAQLPGLGDRLGGAISNFLTGKDLTDKTRKDMFDATVQRYKALDDARARVRKETEMRAGVRVQPSAIGSQVEQVFGTAE